MSLNILIIISVFESPLLNKRSLLYFCPQLARDSLTRSLFYKKHKNLTDEQVAFTIVHQTPLVIKREGHKNKLTKNTTIATHGFYFAPKIIKRTSAY